MKLNISRLFDNKTFCKVFSIISAVLIWAAITLTVKTESERVFRNVPIDFSVEGTAVAALGLGTFDHSDDFVNIRLSGNRRALNSVSKDDFSVTLSLGRVTSSGKQTVNVDVSLKEKISNINIIDYSPKTIQVNFDKHSSKSIPITTDISTLSAADNFLLDKGYPSVQDVTVSGPESVISTVSKCIATVEMKKKGLTKSLTVPAVKLKLLDENNNEVSNPNLTMDKETVDISVPVLKIKELPVAANFMNKPENFAEASFAYTLSTTKLEIAGPAETIDTLTQIDIRYVDLKEVKPGDTVTLNVELPSGFVNVSNIATIDVTIPVNNMQEAKYNVEEFKLISVPEDKEVTLVTQRLNDVTLYGVREIVAGISAQDIIVEVDLTNVNLSSGTAIVPARITVPNKSGIFWPYGSYDVVIRTK